MKKLSFFAVVVFAALSMSSCTKDRTCSCTDSTTSTEPGYTAQSSSSVTTFKKVKTSDADLWCGSNTSTSNYDVWDNTVSPPAKKTYIRTETNTCTLK
ncbi:MAG: hypothetical protein HY252_12940 [Sphingobacteriales bacterium]|nr:hypothetical protein [Sphingobacteriales bacterium]